MELTLRPFVTAGVALTAASAIAVAPVAPPTPAVEGSVAHVAAHVSARAVQLTDAWTDLIPFITGDLTLLLDTAQGIPVPPAGAFGKLPPTSNPIAPILEQFVINQIGYAVDLLELNPAAILTQVQTNLTNLGNDVSNFETYAGGILENTLSAITFPVVTIFADVAGNLTNLSALLQALYEAPPTILEGEIGFLAASITTALDIRNRIATDLDPPLPSWPAPATATSATPAKTVTLSVTAPAGGSTPVTSTTPITALTTNVVPDRHNLTPTVLTTNASTPGTHLSTRVNTVTAPLNTTVNADLGATHHGSKTPKK